MERQKEERKRMKQIANTKVFNAKAKQYNKNEREERRMEKVREMRKSTMHLHQQGFRKDPQVRWNQSRLLL